MTSADIRGGDPRSARDALVPLYCQDGAPTRASAADQGALANKLDDKLLKRDHYEPLDVNPSWLDGIEHGMADATVVS